VRRIAKRAGALGSAGANAVTYVINLFFERRYGIETSGEVSLQELGLTHPEHSHYTPAGWLTLRHILRNSDIARDDVFLDLGSGKGRAVLVAAQYPFKRVIGVEISRDLHTIATANIRRNMHRLACRNIELVNRDVLEFEVPEDVTVTFLFNPFTGRTFISMIERILQSIDARPRPVTLIYINPVEHESLLATGRAELIRANERRVGSEFRVYRLS
jgi:SAM-dependent methyltransferase